MAGSYTFHGANVAQEGSGKSQPALGPQVGNRVDIASAAASAALASAGWCRVSVVAATYVKFDSAATNGTNGEYWPAGQVEARFLPAGAKIGMTDA